MNSVGYEKLINAGARVLEDGSAELWRRSNRVSNRLIRRVMQPNGSYCAQVYDDGRCVKTANKTVLDESRYVLDTWNFSKNQGVNVSTVKLEGKSFMSRAFDKKQDGSLLQDGLIYLFRQGDRTQYQTAVKALSSSHSVAKPFSQMGWLNDKFCQLFVKSNSLFSSFIKK